MQKMSSNECKYSLTVCFSIR